MKKFENIIRPLLLQIRLLFLLCLSGLMISGCLEEIDLDTPQNFQDSFVIEGRMIYGDVTEISVNVSKVFDFSPNNVLPVVLRYVILHDDQGNSVELDSPAEGFYQIFIDESNPDMQITLNKAYKLEAATFDNRVYETSFESIMQSVEATDLQVTTFQKDVINSLGDFDTRPYFLFTVSSSLGGNGSGERPRLRYEVERTYKLSDTPMDNDIDPKTCYITETPALEEIRIVDGNELNADMIENFPVYETPMDFRFAEGYYLTIYQQALTESAYTYWDQVSQLVNRTGNMFESPAGKLVSNFTNIEDPKDNVFGFFYATQQDTIRLFVSPSMAGNPFTFCPVNVPAPPGRTCPVPVCCDCLSEKLSTTVQPTYWVE